MALNPCMHFFFIVFQLFSTFSFRFQAYKNYMNNVSLSFGG